MSRSRKGRGGSGGSGKFGRFVFGIFVLALVVAIYQIPYDPGVKGISEIAKSKAEHAEEWAKGVAPSIEKWIGDLIRGGREAPTDLGIPDGEKYEDSEGTGGNDLGTYGDSGSGDAGNDVGSYENSGDTVPGETYDSSNVAGIISVLNNLTAVDKADSVKYDRNEWKHWVTSRKCLDVRQAVLIRDGSNLVMEDSKGKETTDVNKGCKVISGEWVDLYTGKMITDPKSIDIDHFIPLKYAATHNGQAFSKDRKQEYANDMTSNRYHLIAVSAKENRTKSDKGPSSYLPPDKTFHCTYASTWVDISNNYGLSISKKDKETITQILTAC